MFGYYQFKNNNNYNKPIGIRQGLSIFPYKGLYNTIPYSRAIPIRRARYSRTRLEGDNAPYTDNITTYDIEQQHIKGPLPYIYKARITGLTPNLPCATVCNELNDKDFYLYGSANGLGGFLGGNIQASWINTFTDSSNPNGFYKYGQHNTNYAGISMVLDLLTLVLCESLDTDVDKSYLILTLGSSMANNYVSDNVLSSSPVYPFLFVKEFAKGEHIFALEEEITLTAVNSFTIDNGGAFSSPTYGVHEGIRYCDFSSASVTLTPYQTDTYDIYNNHNVYADLDNLGTEKNIDITIPIATSSGNIPLDRYFGTTQIRSLASPSAFTLSMSGVTTKEQGNHVECGEFFNREFKIKGNITPQENISTRTVDSQQVETLHSWDNEVERLHAGDMLNYVGLQTYSSDIAINQSDPYLNNISLSIAGTGNYLELRLYDSNLFGGRHIAFRHAYNKTIPLNSTTFNNWVYDHTANGYSLSETYCNFSGVAITLTPTDTNFQQGKVELPCMPLCSDGLSPTIANINIRISGSITNDGRRVEYDRTLDLITDFHPNFISSNGEFAFNLNGDGLVPADYFGDLYYYCNADTPNKLLINGSPRFSPQAFTIHTTLLSGGGGSPTGLYTGWVYGFNINIAFGANQFNPLYGSSGCPTRFDCTLGKPFKGTVLHSGVYSPGGFAIHTTTTVNLAATGVITFDGFL